MNVGMNLLALIDLVAWPVFMDPILVGGLASLATVLVVSSFTAVSPEEADYRDGLHRLPDAERDPGEIQRTLRWPRAMVAVGLVTMTLLYLFYARPYGAATASAGALVMSPSTGVSLER